MTTLIDLSKYKQQLESIEKLLATFEFNGSILVAIKDQQLLNKGYGYADFLTHKPAMRDTVYRIGSISKSLTAIAIMQLIASNQLHSEDRLSKFLPDFTGADQITIEDLIAHTSGIREYLEYVDIDRILNEYHSPSQLIERMKREELVFEPGSRFGYSNSNYLIVGWIIEQVSGLTWEDYMQKHIFLPLNCSDSGYREMSESVRSRFATGYYSCKPTLQVVESYDPSGAYAAGGLYSSTQNLFKIVRSWMCGELLDQKWVDEMVKYRGREYGYGWVFFDLEKSIIGHGGMIPGYLSFLIYDQRNEITIIVLSNVEETKDNDIAFQIHGVLVTECEN